MEERDGYRKFLEIQVEALQEQLYALERDPQQVEHLKSMLRTVQRLRHAQGSSEPEPVRILRNAVEKVTLHVGRAGLTVTQDFLDFYVDSFELLEEAVRRWPGGPSFDRARYADRVRGLLGVTATGVGAGPSDLREAGVQAPFGHDAARGATMAEEPVSADVAAEIVLTEPEPAAQPASDLIEEPAVEVLTRTSLADADLDSYVEADLQDLLLEPWGGAPSLQAPAARAGGLAASFATYEAIRGGRGAAVQTPSGVRESVERLRDVLDTFSVALGELDRAAERVLREGRAGLDDGTRNALADRLRAEKDKVLLVFERTIDTFHRAEV